MKYRVDAGKLTVQARSKVHDTTTVWDKVTGDVEADANAKSLERAVAELVDAANRNGGTDNVTTLLLQCLAA